MMRQTRSAARSATIGVCFGVAFAACPLFAAFPFDGTLPRPATAQAALAAPASDLDEELEAAPSRWERLKSYVADAFAPETETVDKAGASTRGDGPEILADPFRHGIDKNNRLIAGERALHIRWTGGEAPFRLHLLREENGERRPVMAEQIVEGRAADLPAVDLRPGVYALVLKDKAAHAVNPDPQAGPAVVMDLEVEPASARPAMPAEIAATPCSDELKALLHAGSLLKAGEGEWTLEAMQLVRPLADGSKKAAAWLDKWGGR